MKGNKGEEWDLGLENKPDRTGVWGRHVLHFFPWSNASLSRGVRTVSPSFPSQRPGHQNANRTSWVPSTTSLMKHTRAFSDCRQDLQLGIRRHKDMCFPFTYFFTLHGHSPVVLILTAYNPLRAWTSPLSSTSSCHQKIKKKKINAELEAVHFRGSAHKQLHRFRWRECLWIAHSVAGFTIYYFIYNFS